MEGGLTPQDIARGCQVVVSDRPLLIQLCEWHYIRVLGVFRAPFIQPLMGLGMVEGTGICVMVEHCHQIQVQ